MNNYAKIDKYLELVKKYPDAFDNSANELEIITDRNTLYEKQKNLYSTADSKNQPLEWYDLGIVAQDAWVIVLRDLVKFPNGRYGGYIRMINRKSQLEMSGKDVVILVKQEDMLLLMKHFRHDDRTWHWECPRGFGESGLTPEENALKEVKEETGLKVTDIIQLNKDDDRVIYFIANCIGSVNNADKMESISDYKFVGVSEFKQMITNGFVNDQYTIKAFTLADIQSLL
ncbi:MAG: NUDIX hydrolase [Oscillospiraceae bacterium]|nr:NUDIX hydrolase [Oscillospiraceae bacterium]